MLLDPHTVTGLGDAGAHVNLISDCSASTFHLTHWGRDRSRGERLPVELLVQKLSGTNAALYGFDDRGVVAPGRRADLNVIDFDRLRICAPEVRHDLPTGASRILQAAEGYLATMVDGVVTREHDADTGQRPGRLLRGARTI
jgi:N-acyl-D-aspartate/D-glutamate deacylase